MRIREEVAFKGGDGTSGLTRSSGDKNGDAFSKGVSFGCRKDEFGMGGFVEVGEKLGASTRRVNGGVEFLLITDSELAISE